MRQRLVAAPQPLPVSVDDCSFDICPQPHTCRTLDLVYYGERVCPAIVLQRDNRTRLIVFTEGFPAQEFFSQEGRLRDFQANARVWFETPEPTGPVYVLVYYEGALMTRVVSSAHLSDFMNFRFE